MSKSIEQFLKETDEMLVLLDKQMTLMSRASQYSENLRGIVQGKKPDPVKPKKIRRFNRKDTI